MRSQDLEVVELHGGGFAVRHRGERDPISTHGSREEAERAAAAHAAAQDALGPPEGDLEPDQA